MNIVFIVIIVAFIIMLVIKLASGSSSSKSSSSVPTSSEYRLRSNILTPTELNFYSSLDTAIAGRYLICPKVRIIDFIEGKSFANNQRIMSKHCDFLICSRAMKPLFVIELDDKSHQTNATTIKNDKFKDELYKVTGIKLIRIKVSSIYNTQELRNLMS